MKRALALILILTLACSLAACGGKKNESAADAGQDKAKGETQEETQEAAPDGAADSVMTYAEFDAAPMNSQIVIETYVQAAQAWKDGKVTLFAQDEDGGYYLYEMACPEEDYKKLRAGQKIRVIGSKSEWSGQIEIVDAVFELEKGSFVASPADMTALLGREEELLAHQNQLVSFKGMTVEPSKGPDGQECAFLYNWDGSGKEGDDLFFEASKDGHVISFMVESDLCGASTEVYQAVQKMETGSTVDLEGFLYWYEGPNPRITSVKVK